MSICHAASVVPACVGINATYELALSQLDSSDNEIAPTSATAGIKVKRAGTVQEIISDVYTDQNPTTEWIAAAQQTSTIGDLFECWLEKIGGTDPSTGPTLATWHTISSDLTWEWTVTSSSASFIGIIKIREIANPANTKQTSVLIGVESI